MRLFGTMSINDQGHLTIGGCDATDLTRQFSTPLYVIDEELVRQNCRRFKEAFSGEGVDTEVVYASKAFSNLAICKVINEEGLALDVVSGGELYTAIKAGFPMEKIYFHGNNKTYNELEMALEAGVGRIVVDNCQELELLEELCASLNKTVEILLRVNPGIEAHTHAYIQTSKSDSKFGEAIYSQSLNSMIEALLDNNRLILRGFHCHIGSQIFEEESYHELVKVMLEFISKMKVERDLTIDELNLGGGFGVYYNEEDMPMDIKSCLGSIIELVNMEASRLNVKVPKLMIEPGRAIVANAGTTLYEIGATKKTQGGRDYIFVDGGMTDNPRPALYDAKYEAIIANKAENEGKMLYTIAGKCCESGDIIIRDIKLPEAQRKDILAVFTTGAYNYSMASNYNRIPKPAVVFVKNGKPRLAVRRESYEDILKNDLLL